MSFDSVISSQTPNSRVGALLTRAEQLIGRGRFVDGLCLFELAIEADSTPAARIALAVAVADVDSRRAIDELERAWDDARRQGSPWYRAICCRNLATMYQQLGNGHLADRYHQYAIAAVMDLRLQGGAEGLLVDLFVDLAVRWFDSEDASHAEQLLNAARELAITTSQQAIIATTRGVLSARTGALSDAIPHWSRAQRQFREASDPAGTAHVLMNLGHGLVAQQRYPLARRAFLMAGELYRRLEAPTSNASAEQYAREVAARARVEHSSPQCN